METGLGVVTPVHNGAAWIADALRSSLASSLVERHVVIDDLSTDETVDVVRQLRADDGRVVLLRRLVKSNQYACMNLGVSWLMERGFSTIAFLDADDIALPHRFEHQFRELSLDLDLLAVGGLTAEMDAHGVPSNRSQPEAPAFPMVEDPVPMSLRKMGIGIWSCVMMARAEAFEAIGGFDWTPTMGDTDFSMRLCFWADMMGQKVRNLQSSVNFRRIHEQSVQANIGRPNTPYRAAYTKLLQQRHTFWSIMRRQNNLHREQLYRPLQVPEYEEIETWETSEAGRGIS